MAEMQRMPLEVAKAQIQVGGSGETIAIYYLHNTEVIRCVLQKI